MSQSVIPNQFESYLTERSEAGLAPNMNEFVFAYLPNLDLDTPVDVNSGLPSESQIVHRQDVDQSARINSNTLVYTVILASDLPSFTFNAIYLHDKNTPNSVGFIVHKEDEVKESGLTITKSIAQSYEGAEDIADIHVAPQTWQIDYQARLAGIDDDVRLLSIDHYYHHAFVSGFDVTKVSDSQVEVAEGVAYVGGLRCELMESVTVNASSGTIYLDVSRDGSVLSRHVNHVNVRVSATTLSDYQDTNGRFHYLAPIARFSSGHWEDLRVQEVVSQTEAEAGTATTARKWTAQRISQAIKKQRKVVGETYVQFPGRAAPASLFGGTWSALFESEGVFFRTPGGDATAFGGGIQGDAIRNITGSFNTNSSYFSSASYAHATGPFTASEASGSPLRRNSGGEGSDVMNIKFDASKIVPTSTENRPKNRTIRVWYKTE